MPLGMLFSLEFKAMPMIHSDNHDLDQLEEFMVICVRSCELTEQSAWKNCKPDCLSLCSAKLDKCV